MKKKSLISIIVPCLNEEEAIPVFHKEVDKVSKEMSEADFEILFVDDGSTDKSLKVMKDLVKKDNRVKYISFSRNFGKEAAMLAGLEKVTGDYITFMDVDLQDPPKMLIEMYDILNKEDYDCVALYTNSHEGYSFIRKGFTNIWYKLVAKMAKSKQKPGARDFRLMTRQMVDSILSMREYNRYMKGMFDYVGYKTKWIAYEAPIRAVGTSKFNIRKLVKYAVEGIISTSTVPLTTSVFVGLLFCLISFIAILVIIIKTLIFGDPVQGWPSLACIVLFVSGVQLFFLGVIGTYMSKIFLEVKNRPVYIIKEESE